MTEVELKELEKKLQDGWIPDKPYIFVSYASKNKEEVFATVLELRKRGINVYIDVELQENISKNWIDNVKDRLYDVDCKGMVSFVSIDFMRSYACLMEQLMPKSDFLHKKKGKFLTNFYISLDPRMGTAQGIWNVIYGEEAKESQNMKVTMMLEEKTFLEEAMNDNSSIRDSVIDITKELNAIKTKHDVVINMYSYFFEKESVSIQPYKSAEECANLLYKNLVNEKNDSISIDVLPELKERYKESKPSIVEQPIVEQPIVEPSIVEQPIVVGGKDTSVKRSTITGDITYTLYGEEYTHNQSDMMLTFFAQVLKRHQDKVSELPEYSTMNCASSVDYSNPENRNNSMPSYFRVNVNFEFENGSSVCIGTAYSIQDKLKKMAGLLKICEESKDVFSSKQVELPEVSTPVKGKNKKGSSRGGGNSDSLTYSIYGNEYHGNQSEMMQTVFYEVLSRHTDILEEAEKQLTCVSLTDYSGVSKENKPVYFNTMRAYEIAGRPVSIGASYGMTDKLKLISRLLKLCDEPTDVVKVEGHELPEAGKRGHTTNKSASMYL